MSVIVLHFLSQSTANFLVAGVPAAARAAHQVARANASNPQPAQCLIAVQGGWTPGDWCRAELSRLAPGLNIGFVDLEEIETTPETTILRGESLTGAEDIQTIPTSRTSREMTEEQALAELGKAGEAILLATAKPGDGIVSRYINRPISRSLSRLLLRLPGVVPFHATVVAAVLGIAMAVCLFAGGPSGLVAGAVLFQAASIIDGVDGEIARATYRSSPKGAMLDSLTDAATNLAFIAGLTFNLWQQGHDHPAAAGIAGLAMLAIGMFLIGLRARSNGGPFTFDGVKHHFRARPSRLMQWLTWIAMRDFYAAASAVLIVIGFAPQTLVVFSAATSIWFVITLRVLFTTRPRASAPA